MISLRGNSARVAPAAVLVALALSGAAPAGASPATPIAISACTHVTIGGENKCIARGQYCKRRFASQYTRYGLHCTKLDSRGRYHLR